MCKVIAFFDRLLARISQAATLFAGLCILATALIIVYEIIMRGVFHAPTEWVLEISVYLILTAGFLGLSVAFRQQAHVRVDFITERLSPRTQCILEILTTFLSALFFLVFITESADLVDASLAFHKLSPSSLRFPLFIPQLALVLGGTLLFLEMVRQMFFDVHRLRTGCYDDAERQG